MITKRNKKYVVTATLSLAVVILFLGYGIYHNFIKEPSLEEVENFIINNHTVLNLDGEGVFIPTDLFKNDLKKEVFLTGEVHATSKNYDLELAWIKYLHEEAGVRYLLRETGFGTGQLLNQFLETGDETILKMIYSNLTGTMSCTKESYDFWKKLYQYNEKLPKDEKLLVVGIDVDHQKGTGIWYLSSLIPESEPPKEIASAISILRLYPQDETILGIAQDLKTKGSYYEDYFKEDYFNFKMIIQNLENTIRFYANNQDDEIREESIYQNFLKVYEHLPKGKFYGQWGAEHIFHKVGMDYVEIPFAARLQRKESPVKGQVVSIYYSYEDSQFRRSNGEIYDIPNTVQINVAEELLSQENLLLKLTGIFSPFNHQKETRQFGDREYSFKTTENVQYILFIKNSSADTELKLK